MIRIEFLPNSIIEIDTIADYYLKKVGALSAQRIVNNIMNAIENLKEFPLIAPKIHDEQLSKEGYRILIVDEFICIYRFIDNVIYIYHIANGRTEYKNLIY